MNIAAAEKMEPISVIGLASNILTFIDFSCAVIKGSYEVYKSATRSTLENSHLSTVIDDLAKATNDLAPEVEAKTKHSKGTVRAGLKLFRTISRPIKDLEPPPSHGKELEMAKCRGQTGQRLERERGRRDPEAA